MSSVTSSFAQRDKNTKFLIVVASDISGYVVDGLYSVIASDELGGTATFDLSGATSLIESGTNLSVGTLLKDLGRQITIVSAANNLVRSVYRQVQVVNGADSEGVGGAAEPATASTAAIYNCFYVKVFDSAGAGVRVVRTG